MSKADGEISLDSASFGLMIIGDFIALVLVFTVFIYIAHHLVTRKYPCICYHQESDDSVFKDLKLQFLWNWIAASQDKSRSNR